MFYAPIIIFAFNRLESLKATVASVLRNTESAESEIFVFVDGARPRIEGEHEKVLAVQEYVKTISGFKSITYTFSDKNKGLGPSIISGVTEVINKYGRVIVLEDDLVVAKGFLSFMNTMLEAYKNDVRIMQVSGFSTEFKIPHDYDHDIYLNRRAESWSWATWKDRWYKIDWEVRDFNVIKNDLALQRQFNDIGSDLYGMLVAAVQGKPIWAVKFAYTMFKAGAYQVSPIRSLVRNEGFKENSSNCNVYNRYRYEFNDTQTTFVAMPDIPYNRRIDKAANRYWTVSYRIYGKLMTLIYKII